MFEEEFILFPSPDDDHRACYITEELKIQYIMPFITDGITDLCKCITHEWLHGLIDWAMDGDDVMKPFKNCYDPEGNSDHFIMRLINFD